jgi:hypothetical protein
MSDNELIEVLKQLSATVKKMIGEGISNGTIKPQDEVYFRWKTEKFEYTDKGVTSYSARGEYFTKQSWFRATIKLEQSIKRSSEYSSALEHLTKIFGDKNRISSYLDYFIMKLIYHHLPDSETKETDVESLITTFLKDLREEPVRYGAEVELQGVALQPERIEPGFGITLRKTKIEDLERELPAYTPFMGPHHLPKPSAILNIEFLGRGINELQRRLEQAIAILRLFKIGSVEHTVYHMKSESITDIMASGSVTSGRVGGALETYSITYDDVQKLKKFWQTMPEFIPESFFKPGITGTDYLTIAYRRYCDALFENGLIERRIANAVMGLEALFLKPGELQELPYRLSVRVGKMFELLGRNPHEIKKVIRDAYNVRNLFAHGGQLSYERKKKLESKYGDVKNLLLSVLDCLRIMIFIMVIGRKEKDELVDSLDDSLIDRKREEQLSWVISRAKEILW